MAGVDMFMEPKQAPNNPTGWQEDFIPTLTQLVEDDVVPISRIDDAVSRILTAKFELGLFENPMTDRSNLEQGRQQGAPRRGSRRRRPEPGAAPTSSGPCP